MSDKVYFFILIFIAMFVREVIIFVNSKEKNNKMCIILWRKLKDTNKILKIIFIIFFYLCLCFIILEFLKPISPEQAISFGIFCVTDFLQNVLKGEKNVR